jgi:hypothetical protein
MATYLSLAEIEKNRYFIDCMREVLGKGPLYAADHFPDQETVASYHPYEKTLRAIRYHRTEKQNKKTTSKWHKKKVNWNSIDLKLLIEKNMSRKDIAISLSVHQATVNKQLKKLGIKVPKSINT